MQLHSLAMLQCYTYLLLKVRQRRWRQLERSREVMRRVMKCNEGNEGNRDKTSKTSKTSMESWRDV